MQKRSPRDEKNKGRSIGSVQGRDCALRKKIKEREEEAEGERGLD